MHVINEFSQQHLVRLHVQQLAFVLRHHHKGVAHRLVLRERVFDRPIDYIYIMLNIINIIKIINICIYVYMYICMYVCMYVCVCVCV
jgi:hypothetical protein